MANQAQGSPSGLGYEAHLSMPYKAAIDRVKEELSKEGFGVLTEIDISQKLKEKVGVDFRPYTILGACNPHLAYEALAQDLSVGLLLPCNVVLYEDGDSTVVSFVKPMEMLDATGNEALQPVAEQADAKIRRVFDRLNSSYKLRAS